MSQPTQDASREALIQATRQQALEEARDRLMSLQADASGIAESGRAGFRSGAAAIRNQARDLLTAMLAEAPPAIVVMAAEDADAGTATPVVPDGLAEVAPTVLKLLGWIQGINRGGFGARPESAEYILACQSAETSGLIRRDGRDRWLTGLGTAMLEAHQDATSS